MEKTDRESSSGYNKYVRSRKFKTDNKREKHESDDKAESNDSKRKDYVSVYKRAQLNYKRLREERKNEIERQRIEQEKKREKAEFQKEWRKKNNQVLQLKTRKGQPNLNAQIGMILEKLEKDKETN
ncbi:hypothetical protein ACQ4LE_010038 [Meloidogyne hapla]|uniref:Small vasohibin-binding protein n=1 Tax=Meloidogyne hapla TaxID=6305 RepID=A0A1I8BBB9_MELHA